MLVIRRRFLALALLLAWASLGLHGVASTDLVRLRNALHFAALPPAAFDWTPASLPVDYLREQQPPTEAFRRIAAGLALPADDDWEQAVRISRHLLTSAPQLKGGAVQTDLLGSYEALTRDGRGYCADFVRAFQAVAGAAGLTMRSWAFAFDGYGGHGHIVIELWNRQRGRWELLDLHSNVYFAGADGLPLDAGQLRVALREGRAKPSPLIPEARPGFKYEAKLLEYYGNGLAQWYLWWGHNPYTLDSLMQGPGWLRPLRQLQALAQGLQPAPRAIAAAESRAALQQMRHVQWHLAAVALLSLLLLLGLLWPRRRHG